MNQDLELWFQYHGDGEFFFKHIGLKPDRVVLDFGCGSGIYTIPAARIIGNLGKIYAVDYDAEVLTELQNRIASECPPLTNIVITKTNGELNLNFQDEKFDFVLLYDILHQDYFTSKTRKILLKEIYRISKPDAIISLFPKHIDRNKLSQEMRYVDFYLDKKLSEKLIHGDEKGGHFEQEYILNFRKEMV